MPKDLTRADYRASWAKMVDLLGAMHKAGVPIVAGTDGSGIEIVRELEIYREAGFTPAEALAAGHRYVSQGRVRRLALAEDGLRIEAETQGTQRKPYRQTITLRIDAAGRIGFTGHCSCPVRVNCNHVAAVLVAAPGFLDDPVCATTEALVGD